MQFQSGKFSIEFEFATAGGLTQISNPRSEGVVMKLHHDTFADNSAPKRLDFADTAMILAMVQRGLEEAIDPV